MLQVYGITSATFDGSCDLICVEHTCLLEIESLPEMMVALDSAIFGTTNQRSVPEVSLKIRI